MNEPGACGDGRGAVVEGAEGPRARGYCRRGPTGSRSPQSSRGRCMAKVAGNEHARPSVMEEGIGELVGDGVPGAGDAVAGPQGSATCRWWAGRASRRRRSRRSRGSSMPSKAEGTWRSASGTSTPSTGQGPRGAWSRLRPVGHAAWRGAAGVRVRVRAGGGGRLGGCDGARRVPSGTVPCGQWRPRGGGRRRRGARVSRAHPDGAGRSADSESKRRRAAAMAVERWPLGRPRRYAVLAAG